MFGVTGLVLSPDGANLYSAAEFDGDGAVAVFDREPLDTTPPDTTIDSGPTGTIDTPEARFTFSGNPAGDTAKIQCRIDAGAFADCTNPKTFTGLSEGSHTAAFRAEDAAGNQDPNPATRTFTVDLTPPDTLIDSGPQGPTNDVSPSFGFSSSETGSNFECSLNNSPGLACTSPKAYPNLRDGSYTFSVRATDPAGNTDSTAATRSFIVDTDVEGSLKVRKKQPPRIGGGKVYVETVVKVDEPTLLTPKCAKQKKKCLDVDWFAVDTRPPSALTPASSTFGIGGGAQSASVSGSSKLGGCEWGFGPCAASAPT